MTDEDNKLILSPLGHTWILDLDGTIVKHNGYRIDGHDSFLPCAKEFLAKIPKDDMVIFLTSRTEPYKKQTIDFLKENGVRYDHIIFDAPYGERILINDRKPSGLEVSKSINSERNVFMNTVIRIDERI